MLPLVPPSRRLGGQPWTSPWHQWMILLLLPSRPLLPFLFATTPISSAPLLIPLILSSTTLYSWSKQFHFLPSFSFFSLFSFAFVIFIRFAELMDDDPPLARLLFSRPTDYLRIFDDAAVWAHVCNLIVLQKLTYALLVLIDVRFCDWGCR